MLTKRLLVSTSQLDGLLTGDASTFHTYGIFLRAFEQLMFITGVVDDPEAKQDLLALKAWYDQSPRGSHIRKVRETVNQNLGVAPSDAGSHGSSKLSMALVLLFVVLALLLGVAVLSRVA